MSIGLWFVIALLFSLRISGLRLEQNDDAFQPQLAFPLVRVRLLCPESSKVEFLEMREKACFHYGSRCIEVHSGVGEPKLTDMRNDQLGQHLLVNVSSFLT